MKVDIETTKSNLKRIKNRRAVVNDLSSMLSSKTYIIIDERSRDDTGQFTTFFIVHRRNINTKHNFEVVNSYKMLGQYIFHPKNVKIEGKNMMKVKILF